MEHFLINFFKKTMWYFFFLSTIYLINQPNQMVLTSNADIWPFLPFTFWHRTTANVVQQVFVIEIRNHGQHWGLWKCVSSLDRIVLRVTSAESLMIREIHSRATLIHWLWYWYWNRQTDQWHGIENPEIKPTVWKKNVLYDKNVVQLWS